MVLIEHSRKGDVVHYDVKNSNQLLELIKSIKTHTLILQDESGQKLDICEVLKCQRK